MPSLLVTEFCFSIICSKDSIPISDAKENRSWKFQPLRKFFILSIILRKAINTSETVQTIEPSLCILDDNAFLPIHSLVLM